MGLPAWLKRSPESLATPGFYHGLQIRKHKDGTISELDRQDRYNIPASYVEKAVAEGWMSYPDGYTVVHRPGGNKSSKWSTTHTFIQAKTLAIHFSDGVALFKVHQNPDKWGSTTPIDDSELTNLRDADGDFVSVPGSDVRWYYLVERVNG